MTHGPPRAGPIRPGPGWAASIHRLVPLDDLPQWRIHRKPGPMPLRQFLRAAQERLDAGAVDDLRAPAGPGRKTDAEDRADVGVGHAGEHAFGQAARGLDGLAVEQAVLNL